MNPLLNAQKPTTALAPPPKESAVISKAAPEEKGYVPPPPAAGPKLPAPAGMPKVKEFPISTGAPPATMSFPNIQSAAPVVAAPTSTGSGDNPSGETPAAEANDGFTPEERRKN